MAWKPYYIGIALTIFLISCQHALYKGDVVYLLNEEEIKGEVLRIDSVVVVRGDEEIRIPKDSVIVIKLGHKRKGWDWREVKDIKDPVLKQALSTSFDFPGAGWVNLWAEREILLRKDSTYVYKERRIRRILDEKGKSAGNIKIPYLGRCEKAEILWGRSISDGKIHHLEEIAIERGSVYGRYPRYENEMVLKFALPDCKPNSVIDYAVKIEGRWSEKYPFFYAFTPGDRDPTLYERISVKTDGIEIKMLGPWKKDKDGYVWEGETLMGIVREPHLPPKAYIFPYLSISIPSPIELAPESVYLPGKEPDDIFLYLMKSLEILPFPSNRTSIFPLPPHEVLKNGRGTQMDVAFLFYSILKTKGYDCDFVLTRSREKGEPLGENIREFDGALVRCGDRWYDPGDFLNPPGWISPRYQGTKGYSIEKMMFLEIPKIEEKIEIRKKVMVKGRDAVVEERLSITGEEGKRYRRIARKRSKEVERFLEEYVNNIEQGAELIHWSIENIDDIRKPIEIELRYRIPGFFTPSGRFLVFHILGVHPSAWDVGMERRINPVYIRKDVRKRLDMTIDIPYGYDISYLPPSLSGESQPFDFFFRVKESGGRIKVEWERVERGGVYPKDVYSSYREARIKEATLGEKWIILERRH